MRIMFTIVASPRKNPLVPEYKPVPFLFQAFLHEFGMATARNREFGAKVMEIKVAKNNANKTYKFFKISYDA